MWDPALATRPWQWFEDNVFGLLSRPVIYAPSGAPIYQTRVARHFYQRQAFEAFERERAANQQNRR